MSGIKLEVGKWYLVKDKQYPHKPAQALCLNVLPKTGYFSTRGIFGYKDVWSEVLGEIPDPRWWVNLFKED